MPQKSCGLPSAWRAAQRARDVAFAGVVARDREQPVAAELLVHLREVVERGARRLEHVAAAVEPPVLREAEPLAGARNDLPQAGRAAVRVGERIERALDDRQQRELRRHAAPLELLDDVEQVEVGALEHAIQVLADAPRTTSLRERRRDRSAVGPRETAAQPREQVALLDDLVAQREVRDDDGLERLARAPRRAGGTGCRRGLVWRVPNDWQARERGGQDEHAEEARDGCGSGSDSYCSRA